MENYLVRIQQYIDYKGLKNNEVEAIMVVSGGLIKKNIKEGSQINGKALENFLVHYKDVSPEWIMTGRGEMINKSGISIKDQERLIELEKENSRLEEELNSIKLKYNRNNERLIIMQDNVIGLQEEINRLKKNQK